MALPSPVGIRVRGYFLLSGGGGHNSSNSAVTVNEEPETSVPTIWPDPLPLHLRGLGREPRRATSPDVLTASKCLLWRRASCGSSRRTEWLFTAAVQAVSQLIHQALSSHHKRPTQSHFGTVTCRTGRATSQKGGQPEPWHGRPSGHLRSTWWSLGS